MEQLRDSKHLESPVDSKSASDIAATSIASPDEKDEDEDDEEEEEDKIVEKSYNNRFHKRNKRLPTQIIGVDNTFIAIEPKSGKEVLWNERMLSEKKTERDNRFLTIAKKLKKQAHPFLIRFLDAWITKNDTGPQKLIFINERLDDGTLKQFLCNSTSRSKLLWRRHVGQLLSVLMYLHRLGITHGNLKKEDIYYQSSGILKVGPFMLDAFFGQKTPPSDILAFGILALEIAVWTPAIDSQASTEEEKVKLMLSLLTDPQQRSFIEACLDPNPTSRPKIKALLNHPAVTEVPSLKLLSAKVLVASMKTQPDEPTASGAAPGTIADSTAVIGGTAAKAETPTDFAELLEDYISHLEEDTVIMDVTFPTDQIVKARAWKDFRPCFTNAAKYLEDVKNGFHLFLGYRFGGSAADQEEDDDGTGAGNVVTAEGVTGQPLLPSVSSDFISNAGSTTTSRKHSNSIISTNDTPPTRHLSTTHEIADAQVAAVPVPQMKDLAVKSAVAAAASTAASLIPSSGYESAMPPCQPAPIYTTAPIGNLSEGEMRRRSLPNSFADCILSTNQLKLNVQSMLNGVARLSGAAAPSGLVAITNTPSELTHLPCALSQQTATTAREKRVRQQSACFHAPNNSGSSGISKLPTIHGRLTHAPPHNVPHTPHASTVSTLTQGAAISLASAIGTVTAPATAVIGDNSGGGGGEVTLGVDALAEADISDADLSDDDQNDSDDDDDDDDDDEDEDGKGGAGGGERCFIRASQVVHVAPPTQAPTTPALFTHCQYAYIGAGRWQVYVQMWFVEERLKREAYLQVLENEWHDYDRIANLFESSKCLSSNDRIILVRLLAMARHNIPLIEGELVYPCCSQQFSGGVYAQELYSKLVTLHLHQQSHEFMARTGPTDISDATAHGFEAMGSLHLTDPFNHNGQSMNATSTIPTALTLPPNLDAAAVPTLIPSGAMTTSSDPCRTSVPPSHNAPDSCPHEHADLFDTPIRVNGDLLHLNVMRPPPPPPPAPLVPQPQIQPSNATAGTVAPSIMVGSSTAAAITTTTTTTVDVITPPQPAIALSVGGTVSGVAAPQAPANLLKSISNDNNNNSTSSSDSDKSTNPDYQSTMGPVEMLDVGCLAPENAMCALCDRHDYLHRKDLPNYLTSPCYHCRESLAREAKVNPEDLFDLHLQHNVPWPAFLQARFNIPPDARSMEDLIAYDCQWRGREPCTCLLDAQGPLPPCVEFPWFYTQSPIANASSTAPASHTSAEKAIAQFATTVGSSGVESSRQAPAEPTANSPSYNPVLINIPPTTATSANAETKSADDNSMGQHSNTTGQSAPPPTLTTQPQPSKPSVQSTEAGGSTSSTSKHQHSHTPPLPCASRHARGALSPPQCCDPTGWPAGSSKAEESSQHNHSLPESVQKLHLEGNNQLPSQPQPQSAMMEALNV